MTLVEFELKVICAQCGSDLETHFGEVWLGNQRSKKLEIEPCKTCMEDQRNGGFDEGYEAATDNLEQS